MGPLYSGRSRPNCPVAPPPPLGGPDWSNSMGHGTPYMVFTSGRHKLGRKKTKFKTKLFSAMWSSSSKGKACFDLSLLMRVQTLPIFMRVQTFTIFMRVQTLPIYSCAYRFWEAQSLSSASTPLIILFQREQFNYPLNYLNHPFWCCIISSRSITVYPSFPPSCFVTKFNISVRSVRAGENQTELCVNKQHLRHLAR
jgi:hypothetical protein